MKRIISISTTVLIICLVSVLLISGTTLTASAYTEGDYTYTVSNGEATITKYNGSGGDFVIPDTLGGYPVTTIGDYAFYDCDSLTSVEIGDSVTTIGDYAFDGCSGLTSVYITDIASWCNIEFGTIPSNPLCYADNLYLNGELITDLVIPEGITTIPYYAFSCNSITSVTIPDSVTTIGRNAFGGCTSLSSVYITDIASWCGIDFNNEFSIDSHPLIYADNLYLNGELITDLVIPEGVTTIPTYAFSCNSITSVTIPDSVTSIGDSAFYKCTSLTNVYITDIASWCGIEFRGLTANPLFNGAKLHIKGSRKPIADLVIPDSVTTIGDYAFYKCTSLTSVVIPDSVATIGYEAFFCCSGLTSVQIGKGVTTIDRRAFYDCSGLTSVYITDIASWCNIEFGTNSSNPLCYAEYLYLNCEQITDLVISDGVTTVGNSAFNNCKSLTSVTIPDGVTTIGNSAFRFCTNLTSIVIPDSVTTIGGNAFAYCDSLTSVVIPNSVTSIGYEAFYNCKSLTSVTIEGNIAIKEDTFIYCSKLTDLVFGNRATAILGNFSLLKTLKTLTLTKNIVDMEYNLFINCPLETVYFRGTRAEWDSMVYAQDEQFENVNIIFLCYEHTYDNTCDTVCNECGAQREVTHSFEWIVDRAPNCTVAGLKHEECTVCGQKQNENTEIETNDSHVYDNSEDLICNECSYERPPYVPGDLDGVEGVTDSDAVYLLFHTYFPEDYPIYQPVDYDGDGSITDSDAVYLLFHTYFPEDYPLYATTPAMTVMETLSTKKDEE